MKNTKNNNTVALKLAVVNAPDPEATITAHETYSLYEITRAVHIIRTEPEDTGDPVILESIRKAEEIINSPEAEHYFRIRMKLNGLYADWAHEDDENSVEDVYSNTADWSAVNNNGIVQRTYPTTPYDVASQMEPAYIPLRELDYDLGPRLNENNDARPTFKVCSWQGRRGVQTLAPPMFAREIIVLVYVGDVKFNSNECAYRITVNDTNVTGVKLRAEDSRLPWLPAVELETISENSKGIVIFTSEKGVPFEVPKHGLVSFYPAPSRSGSNQSLIDFSTFSIPRSGCIKSAGFTEMENHPHTRSVEIGNFRLYEEDKQESPDVFLSQFAPLIKVLDFPEERTDIISLTNHPGVEVITPICGEFLACFGAPGNLNGEEVFVDIDADLHSSSGEGGYFSAVVSSGNTVLINSYRALHGFNGEDGPARAVFVGAGRYLSKNEWAQIYFKDGRLKEEVG